jgi:phosphohistidine phosphatase SixA
MPPRAEVEHMKRKQLTAIIVISSFGLVPIASAQHNSHSAPSLTKPSTAPPVVGLSGALVPARDLPDRLKNGGFLIVMRHERTEIPSRDDDYSKPPTDCLSQRNLSVAGLAGAGETGVALRVAGVAIARVIASPMCRTMETARAAFGRADTDARLMHFDPSVTGAFEVRREETLALANGLQLGTENVVLVTHAPNLSAFDVRLGEGEMAVLRKNAVGKWVLIGRATGSEWGFVARGLAQ